MSVIVVDTEMYNRVLTRRKTAKISPDTHEALFVGPAIVKDLQSANPELDVVISNAYTKLFADITLEEVQANGFDTKEQYFQQAARFYPVFKDPKPDLVVKVERFTLVD